MKTEIPEQCKRCNYFDFEDAMCRCMTMYNVETGKLGLFPNGKNRWNCPEYPKDSGKNEEGQPMQKEQQLRVWIQKQKRLISEATEQKDRDYIAMMWQGFLNGLRLTNAITWQEYQELSREIVEYAEGFEAAWEEEKGSEES